MSTVREQARMFFTSSCPGEEIAAVLLPDGQPWKRAAAAAALAAMADDPRELAAVLRRHPGAALVALEILAAAGRLSTAELVRACDEELGPGRGAGAVHAAIDGGLVGQRTGFGNDLCEIFPPFVAGLKRALAAAATVARPEPSGAPAPDRGALVLAALAGELSTRPARMTAQGGMYRRDSEELDRRYATALGERGAELVAGAFLHLGVAQVEFTEPPARTSSRLVVDAAAAAALLASERGSRVRRFAEALRLPRWLDAVAATGDRFLEGSALERAFRRSPRLDGYVPSGWLGVLAATGVLEERQGAYRLAPALRGGHEAPRPAAGRWLVQPNLEVLVPPDAPPEDVVRLAALAEVASLDRAAVLRLTPRSLRAAAEAGVDGDAARRALGARSVAPIPDVVLRAISDHVRIEPCVRAYEGVFAVVPPAAMEALRAHPSFGEAVRAEVAPGVLWVQDGREAAFRDLARRCAVEVRFPSTAARMEEWRAEGNRSHLERWLERGAEAVCPEPDEVLVAKLVRARQGDAAECPAAPPPRPGRSGPERAAPLARLVPRDPDPVVGCGGGGDAACAQQPPMGSDWEASARAAIEGKRELWLQLAGERRPRLVTPHRLALRGDVLHLEALVHESGDLRAWPGPALVAAAVGGPASRERLAREGTVVALRAARNEQCPCGSHKKYKRCCLPRDLAAMGE